MVKPVGPVCNLACRYCYYLEKRALYPQATFRMSDATLQLFVRHYIEAHDVPQVDFAWQGGEPTLMGLDFFRRAVALQQQYAAGKRITNAIQTNALVLDDDWAKFFKQHGFLVGVSIDGPPELHDRARCDASGAPSSEHALRGLDLLLHHGVDVNTLTVVSAANEKQPLDVYRFLKQRGVRFMQFIPLVERMADEAAATLGIVHAMPARPGEHVREPRMGQWAVHPAAFGNFLTTIFDEWVRTDIGTVFVQQFDVALGAWMGMEPPLCVFAQRCGAALIMEHNGDLYACDHYCYPEYLVGSVHDGRPLHDIVFSPQQVKFGNDKADALPRCCKACTVRFACNGDCPKHRFVTSPEGDPNLSYLCPAYKKFFAHIGPHMKTMAELVSSGRPATMLMQMLRDNDARGKQPPGRNAPCPCGSGKKFKRCCGG